MKQLTMTKVLTPLAALAFTFGAQAAAVSAVGFETSENPAYTAGSSVTNVTGWSFVPNSADVVDESVIAAYSSGAPTGTKLPDDYASAGANYLNLSTDDGILFRNMDGAGGATVQLDSGLFVDTDVQFTVTAADESPTNSLSGDDKFIIWLQDNGSSTNLCVYARQFTAGDGSTSVSNVYTLTNAGGDLTITPKTWYRLTVKALPAVGGTFKFPAFQVFLDGEPLKADGAFIIDGDQATQEAFMGIVGNDIVSDGAYFPALVTQMTSLQQVGFSGEGALDNIVVTKEVPGFENPATLTFSWNTDVIGTVTLTDLNLTLAAPGSVRVATTDTPLAIAYTAASGVSLDTYEVTMSGTFVDGVNKTVTPTADTTVTITTTAKDTVKTTFDFMAWVDYAGSITSVMIGDLDVTADVTGSGVAEVDLKLGTNVTIAVNLSTPSAVAVIDAETISSNLSYSGLTVTVVEFGTGAGAGTATVNVIPVLPAATVNDQPYASFADALSAAATAGTAKITLAANVTVNNETIASGKNITIDLAGNDITGAAEAAAVFTVAANGTLTITNHTVDVGIVSKGDATACISNAGTLNLQAGKFDIADGAISGGTINVTGGAYNAGTFTGATLPPGKILAQNTSAMDAYAYELADEPVAQIGGVTYTTLNAAFDEATAGDTVMVLKDITAASLGTLPTISTTLDLNGKKITISGGGYWATVPAGSTLVVTDSTEQATGEIEMSTSGSTLFRVDGTFTLAAGTVDMITAGANNTASAFNVKSGGVGYMNGGTVLGRIASGVTNATMVVNGGTIGIVQSKNCGNVTINGGTITTIEKQGTSEDANILIPGTSDAKFGADYTTYCESGYKTVKSGDWYVVTAKVYYTAIELNKSETTLVTNETETLTATLTPADAADDSVTWTSSDTAVATVENGVVTAVGAGTATITAATKNYSDTCTVTVTAPSQETPIAPGGDDGNTYDTQAAAEAAAEKVVIDLPSAVKDSSSITPEDKAAYAAMFEAKVVPAGENGYKVVVDMKDTAKAAVQAEANADAAAVIEDLSETSVQLTTTPGLYYSFEYGTSLGGMTEGARTMATSSTLSLDRPTTPGATAGFYRVKVSISDK